MTSRVPSPKVADQYSGWGTWRAGSHSSGPARIGLDLTPLTRLDSLLPAGCDEHQPIPVRVAGLMSPSLRKARADSVSRLWLKAPGCDSPATTSVSLGLATRGRKRGRKRGQGGVLFNKTASAARDVFEVRDLNRAPRWDYFAETEGQLLSASISIESGDSSHIAEVSTIFPSKGPLKNKSSRPF